MNSKISFTDAIKPIRIRDFLLLKQQYNSSYLAVPNPFKEMDVMALSFYSH